MYDVIIIGAGPAGLTACIYTSRRNMKTLILSKGLSDQVSESPHVENYPGFKKIKGYRANHMCSSHFCGEPVSRRKDRF